MKILFSRDDIKLINNALNKLNIHYVSAAGITCKHSDIKKKQEHCKKLISKIEHSLTQKID
jgi:hypothetical protein